jgi:hypothetical protein
MGNPFISQPAGGPPGVGNNPFSAATAGAQAGAGMGGGPQLVQGKKGTPYEGKVGYIINGQFVPKQ